MATPQEYTIGANAMVAKANTELETLLKTLNAFEAAAVRNYITAARINAACGAGAQVCLDAVDAFRAEKQAHAAAFHAGLLGKK
jgi:hypothetical protein